MGHHYSSTRDLLADDRDTKRMTEFIHLTVIGLVTSAAYAIAASGLVVTYATSGVFNFAHGAIGMLMVYLYWQAVDVWHWPLLLAFFVVVCLVAPAVGAGIDVLFVRRLAHETLATAVVVTVGLLVLCIGIADGVWSGALEPAPSFFGHAGWHLSSAVFVTWHETITIVAALALAGGLRLFLFETRLGIAMRAMVDQRELVALFGARVRWISTFSWALGASTAALAGVLIAPVLDDLAVLPLTFLVVYAYGAAVLGRLRSLPLTFAGAVVLGLSYSYLIGYPPQNAILSSAFVQGLRGSVPALLLLAVLLAMPSDTISGWRSQSWRAAVRATTINRAVAGSAAFVLVMIALAEVVGPGQLPALATALAEAVVVLSLVPLTGWAGQLSLCQMTFAGLGAFAIAHVGGGGAAGVLVAVALATGAGALVGLTSLRLRGLYVALATFAFALVMDEIFFSTSASFGPGGSLPVPALHLLWVHAGGGVSLVAVMSATFAVLAIGLTALHRGPFGRLLRALKDSEAACIALGLNTASVKMAVFSLSAAVAGLGGVFLGEASTRAGGLQFAAEQSLPLILLGIFGGISTTSGAFVGGFTLGILGSKVQALLPGVPNVEFDVPGVAGAMAGYLPDGLVPTASRLALRMWKRVDRSQTVGRRVRSLL